MMKYTRYYGPQLQHGPRHFFLTSFIMRTPFHYMLALGMLLTGSINTLATKWADNTKAEGSHGETTEFNHPFVQAVGMFMGEFLCLLVFGGMYYNSYGCAPAPAPKKRKPTQMQLAKPFNPLLLALPAICDMTATSTMYVGLTLTYASVFQMLRGTVVIFTGIASVLFLGRKQYLYHWTGMGLVLVGAALVGASTMLFPATDASGAPAMPHAAIGNLLIVLAQIIVAIQMVVEERFIGGYNIPALQVVGLEGLWGMLILSSLVVAMYWIPRPGFMCPNGGDECKHFEDAPDAFHQIGHSWELDVALMGNVLSIAAFNACGVAITKYMSASTRMILDSVRTVVIWVVSVAVGWQAIGKSVWKQTVLQMVGFVILLAGTIIYNALWKVPGLYYPTKEELEEEARKLLEANEKALGVSSATEAKAKGPSGPGSDGASMGGDGSAQTQPLLSALEEGDGGLSLPPVGPGERDDRDADGLATGLGGSVNSGGGHGPSPDVSSLWTPMVGESASSRDGAGGTRMTDAMRTPTMGRATQLKMK